MSNIIQQIFHLPTPFNFVAVIVLISLVAGIITTVVVQIRKYACHRQEVELKRDLVERGLSAGEIEQIIRATTPEAPSDEEDE